MTNEPMHSAKHKI